MMSICIGDFGPGVAEDFHWDIEVPTSTIFGISGRRLTGYGMLTATILSSTIKGTHDDFANSPEELEDVGFFNPLDADSYTRWKNLRYAQGALMKHTTVEEDSETGRRDLKFGGGFIPVKRASDSGEMQQTLEDWSASYNGSSLNLRIYARAGEMYAGTDLITDDPRVEGLLLELEANRYCGSRDNHSRHV